MISISYTLKSLSSLLGDCFKDFWPGFLALDQNRDGRTDGIQFYTITGTEKYNVTIQFTFH